MGEEWKKEGEEMKNERWSKYTRETFLPRCRGLNELHKQRVNKNHRVLVDIGFDRWSAQAKQKFLAEYVDNFILYDKDLLPLGTQRRYEGFDAVLEHTNKGLNAGDQLDLNGDMLQVEEIEQFMQAILKNR